MRLTFLFLTARGFFLFQVYSTGNSLFLGTQVHTGHAIRLVLISLFAPLGPKDSIFAFGSAAVNEGRPTDEPILLFAAPIGNEMLFLVDARPQRKSQN